VQNRWDAWDAWLNVRLEEPLSRSSPHVESSVNCLYRRSCLIAISLGMIVISFLVIWCLEQRPAPRGLSPSARSEAFAALVAAALTVFGSFHGHKMGRQRRNPQKMGSQRQSAIISGDRKSLLRGVALVAIPVVLVPLAWVAAELLHVSSAAAAAVTGAILTITAIDALHDMSSKVRDWDIWGWIIFCLALLVGFIVIAALPEEAEAAAAIAAAVMTAAGTHLGHTEGYKP
jgi:hypothetical protein